MITSSMKKRYAIIVAGGTGTRMGSEMPKQFHNLNGKPILMHTIEQFNNATSKPSIIVVLHRLMENTWRELCEVYNFKVPHRVTFGGDSRFQSVKNGLQEIQKIELNKMEDVYIAIHDAARPLIKGRLIDTCYTTTERVGATVLAVTSVNSIRKGTTESNEMVDRNIVWQVQTPQTFRGDLLSDAFEQHESVQFTDDASVVEKLGYPIYLIPGDRKNIKITYPEDIQIAQLFLS
ncbi:2-C-methyl-D-erythritol 4-phosphate cytidylyltransferase [Sphingobacterium sp. JB170]|nr:2-C-methyl-D-erythritol 4-phosphate cytidylyltransferase [Sphingobacterium sp. JB170]